MGFLPLFFESLSHLICSGQAALSSQSDFFENQETIRGQSFLFSQSFSQSYLLDIAHRDISGRQASHEKSVMQAYDKHSLIRE